MMIAETKFEPYLLIVDDSEEDAELTTRLLRSENLIRNIVHLSDGAEALEYLFSERFDFSPRLVLLDLDMPKIHGLQVLKKLKEDQKRKHIPVVIMSSCNDENVIRESYVLGANGFVKKHTQFEKFNEEIRHMGAYWLKTNYVPGESQKS